MRCSSNPLIFYPQKVVVILNLMQLADDLPLDPLVIEPFRIGGLPYLGAC
jgi:hypothetical protein